MEKKFSELNKDNVDLKYTKKIINDMIQLKIQQIMIQERKDGNSDILDFRRRMQHSKSMKFINFK